VDVEASLRLPGSSVAMLRDLNVTPKRRHSLLQKVRLANALGYVPTAGGWASRGGIRDEPAAPPPPLGVAVSWPDPGGQGRGFTLLDPQLACRHRRWPA
jgi:hypothetical protein